MTKKQQEQIVKRLVVWVGNDGTRAEWHLTLPDGGWHPRHVNQDGKVIRQVAWLPLPGSQALFLQCPTFEALYEGNRGPGKTETLLMDYARDVNQGFGSNWVGWFFRKEHKELQDAVAKAKRIFSSSFSNFEFKRSKADYCAEWSTGEVLYFVHLKTVDDYGSRHGQEAPWIAFDELTAYESEKVYTIIHTCCRTSTPGIRPRIRCGTNPYGPGHNWVKKRFQLPQKSGKIIKTGGLSRTSVRGSLSENFLLLTAQPDYPQLIKESAINESQQRAWMYGDWDVTAGGMFDDYWDVKKHVIPEIPADQIPKDWIISRAYDHGQSHPFALGWWLESNGESITVKGKEIGKRRGDMILWREYYGTTGNENEGINIPSLKIGKNIREKEEEWELHDRIIAGPADHEIYNPKTDRGGISPADDMESSGIFFVRADKSSGSRKKGWEKIRTLLRNVIEKEEEPGLYISESCQHWLNLVPSTPRDSKDLDEITKNYEDHLHDMTRYRVTQETARFHITEF